MAGKRKAPANGRKKKTAKAVPELVHEDGQWYIVSGTKRLDVGRNERLARQMLADLQN